MNGLLKARLVDEENVLTRDQDLLFYNSLMNWIEYAEVYSETNKDKYFGKNSKIGIIRAWGAGFQRIKESLER